MMKRTSILIAGLAFATAMCAHQAPNGQHIATFNTSKNLVNITNNVSAEKLAIIEVTTPQYAQLGTEIPLSIKVRNNGQSAITGYTLHVDIDGVRVANLNNPTTLYAGDNTLSVNALIPAGSGVGKHDINVYISENAQPFTRIGASASKSSTTFEAFSTQYQRRQILLEEFTSQYCTYCWAGKIAAHDATEELNLALISVYVNFSRGDIFDTVETDSMGIYQNAVGYPSASVNRVLFDTDNNRIPFPIGAVREQDIPAKKQEIINRVEKAAQQPVLASIDEFDSYFDAKTRTLTIRANGEISPDMRTLFGEPRIMFYITEDNVRAPQYVNGKMEDYNHTYIARKLVPQLKGEPINDGKYDVTYSYQIPNEWKENDLKVTAVISAFDVIQKERKVTFPSGHVKTEYYFAPKDYNKLVVMNAWQKKVNLDATSISSSTTDEAHEVSRYNAAGQRINKATQGVNIIKLSDGRTVKVLVNP